MSPFRPWGAVLGALFVVLLWSCIDSTVVGPDASDPSPSMAIFDGTTLGSDDFFFLPPLVSGAPSIVGTFNPDLLPGARVCRIEGDPGQSPAAVCADEPPVADFPAGSIPAGNAQYQLSWDTDGPETAPMDTDAYYRLEILVGDAVVGWIELDPQNPNGPGQSTADAYAFRLGETIPVKFWLGTELFCEPEAYVTECTTSAVIDESGGNISLESEGNKLGVIVFEGGLPGDDHPPVTLTLERIDPSLFLQATGTECIPLFDAPQFGDCFRITVLPELSEPLDIPALVSICLDPTALAGIDLSLEQQNQLTMVRFHDSGDDVWEALPDAAGDCPTPTASLLSVPEEGFFRYAALGMNAVADLIGPRPVAASNIRLGAFSSSFSRFRYALPGQMIVTEGDGTVISSSHDGVVDVTIQVVDHEGVPVENAVVHFATDDGTVSAAEAVSDEQGNVTVQWTVDPSGAGEKQLTASALGLLNEEVPEHSESYFFTAESVIVTAAMCLDGWGTAVVDGTFGEDEWACAESLDFTANLSGGGTPATVYWMNDGSDLHFAVRLAQTALDKVNSLRIDFDNDGDGVAEVGDDAIGYDASAASVIDQFLDQRCANRNQSGCGTNDVSVDVLAALANDGTFTTYELSHPLAGDANGQDLVRSAGDALGFYLTLRVGNGAQGNTQVPGFRSYRSIIVH